MNPIDVPKGDRRLYYHGCWMRHKTKGIVKVQVSNLGISAATLGSPLYERVNLRDLKLFFFESGAYNIDRNTAIYMTRKSARTNHKSADTVLYVVAWADPSTNIEVGGNVSTDWLWRMGGGPNPVCLGEAEMRLEEGVQAVAITKDLILYRPYKHTFDSENNAPCNVILRGVNVGKFDLTTREFFPDKTVHLAKRVQAKLEDWGIVHES